MAHFISYSSLDGSEFAALLAKALEFGAPAFKAWLDQRDLRPGQDWDEQIDGAIRTCDSLLLVMSADSVQPNSVCKREWTRALKYRRPIVPLRLHPQAEMPFRLEPRQYLDFTGDFDLAVKRLREHLTWIASPEGSLHTLKECLADLSRELSRADGASEARLQQEIDRLNRQIEEAQRNPRWPAGPVADSERATGSLSSTLEDSPRNGVPDGLMMQARQLIAEPKALSESAASPVFRGRHPKHGDVVLKMLRDAPPESLDWVRSASYEQALGDRFLERGESASGEPWVMLRYVDGFCLGDIVKETNVIAGGLLDDLVLQVLHQLAPLHGGSRPVIHRDVTPNNLILTLVPDATGRGFHCQVRLIDFESACFADAAQTPLAAYGFTPPEQVRGRALLSSDLFALVGTAYFLATGKLPASEDGAPQFPAEAWGVFSSIRVYGRETLLRARSGSPKERPASAVAYLRPPDRLRGTERLPVRREVGVFHCPARWEIRLDNLSYRVEPPVAPATV